LFVSEISIVKVTLILDWLQNPEHAPEPIRNIAIVNVKNDKETYNILKKQKFFTSYPQRNPYLRRIAPLITLGKALTPNSHKAIQTSSIKSNSEVLLILKKPKFDHKSKVRP